MCVLKYDPSHQYRASTTGPCANARNPNNPARTLVKFACEDGPYTIVTLFDQATATAKVKIGAYETKWNFSAGLSSPTCDFRTPNYTDTGKYFNLNLTNSCPVSSAVNIIWISNANLTDPPDYSMWPTPPPNGVDIFKTTFAAMTPAATATITLACANPTCKLYINDSDDNALTVAPMDADVICRYTTPVIIDNQSGDDIWRSSNPGAIYDIDANDDYGDLDKMQYTAWSGPAMTGTRLIAWSDITVGRTGTAITQNWGVDFASLIGGINYISVRASDSSGHVSNTATDAFHVKKDTTPPTAVSSVNDGTGNDIAYTTSSTQLSANWAAAADAESGIKGYWSSIGTTAGASDTAAWTFTMAATTVTRTGLALSLGQTYFFTVAAENNAGLIGAATSSNGAIVVFTASTITSPLNNARLNSLAAISGTATDTSGAGLASVSTAIIRTSDGNYWNGTAWQPGTAWLAVTGTTEWALNTSLPTWQDGISYNVKSQATNNAMHVETPGAGAIFTFDTTPPPVAITSPANNSGTNVTPATVSGTTEASAAVMINGNAATVTGTTFTGTAALTLGDNTITAMATDIAGNSATTSITVNFETIPPVAAITSPLPGASVSGNVTVTGTATDSNFLNYVLEYGAGTVPAVWKQFSTSTSPVADGTLGVAPMSQFSGQYTIRLSAFDTNGNISTATVIVNVAGNQPMLSLNVTTNSWTMISFPLTPDATTITNIIDPVKYETWWWNPNKAIDPTLGKYEHPPSLAAGQAIWIKALTGNPQVALAGVPPDSTSNFDYPLGNGWNQIGTPFNWLEPWAGVQVKSGGLTYTKDQAVEEMLIESTPFYFDGTGWRQLTSMPPDSFTPGMGYFLYTTATSSVSLLYDPAAGDPSGFDRVVRPQVLIKFSISARTASAADLDNIIGIVSTASDLRDGGDLREPDISEPPPGMDKYISLYFPHTDWDAPAAGRYTNDFRSAAGEDADCTTDATANLCKKWNFTVETNDSGAATLTWPSLAAHAGAYVITLTDLATNAAIDMAAQTQYQYTGAARNFKLTVARKNVVPPTTTHTLQPGWNLLSIPLETQDTGAEEQLGDDLQAFDIYQFFDGRFSTPSTADGVDLQAGVGYWIYVPDTADIGIEGTPTDPATPVDVPLKKGWNLVGNPFAEALAWGDNIEVICGVYRKTLSLAAAAGTIGGAVFDYGTDGSYARIDIGGTLQPWKGYLLKSSGACTIEFKE